MGGVQKSCRRVMSEDGSGMRVLALILARGGSKRCPGKNIRMLGGRPLIEWSIDAVKGVLEICDILVSTDEPVIAEAARRAGASVPWLRPPALSSDTATSVDAALHALDWYEAEIGSVDALLLLQPTSPFRTINTIKKGITLFSENDVESVVGVTPTHAHPAWTFTVMNDRLQPFLGGDGLNTRSQDLLPAYVVNGGFYLISPSLLRAQRTFFPKGSVPLVMQSRKEALDIDDEMDFRFAECLAGWK